MEKIKKDLKEVWTAMSGPFMLGLAFAMATIAALGMHGALVCMACIILIIQGLDRM
tara:strand:+ start:286 stop:453 length:168 start_codon:yes stop_codon:yes gene_type:complete